MDMALFIRRKYEEICEKRWKYILEYNRLKKDKSLMVLKKEKQLVRILALINQESLLNEDILPEKYKILDEAMNFKDSPKLP
jgi:hypothetical protein